MEESEKRRERLRAMRMEAAQVDAIGNVDEPALPSYLSNPLIENSSTTLSQVEECSTGRFDFYTDPMAAFSSSKRKSNDVSPRCSGFPTSQIPSNSAGTRDPESRPPAPHFQRDHLQGPSHGCSSAPYGSPVRTTRPFSVNQAPSMARQFYQPHPGPSPGSGWAPRPPPLGHSASTGVDRGTRDPESRPPAPHFQRDHLQGPSHGCSSAPYGGPVRTTRPFSVNQAPSMARQFYQPHPGPSPGSGWAPWPPPLGHSASTGVDRGTTLDWAPRPSHSPIPRSGYPVSTNPGRGRGRANWSGTHTSPGSDQWVSSHGRGSGFAKPSSQGFYDESMLEDPWKFLEPILWKNVNRSSKFRELELKSLAAKRARASESWIQSSSQQSLAEYLAASLNEAVDGASSS